MEELRAYAKNMMCLDDPSLIEIRGDYSSPRAMTLQLELRETNLEQRDQSILNDWHSNSTVTPRVDDQGPESNLKSNETTTFDFVENLSSTDAVVNEAQNSDLENNELPVSDTNNDEKDTYDILADNLSNSDNDEPTIESSINSKPPI